MRGRLRAPVTLHVTRPAEPVAPGGPCGPAAPARPVRPVRPTGPRSPVDAGAPLVPLVPFVPFVPAGPLSGATPVPRRSETPTFTLLMFMTSDVVRTPVAVGWNRTSARHWS